MSSNPLDHLTRDELIEVVLAQHVFTEGLRKVATVALAHANHLVSNYARKVPDEKMSDWAKAQVDASALLIQPAPVVAHKMPEVMN